MFKIRSFKQTFILLFVLAILLVLLAAYKKSQLLPIVISQIKPTSNLTLELPDNYAFRQDDPRWGSRTLGKTKDRISEYGCTLTSVAIAASNLLKAEISPAKMNTRLTNSGGYTETGWLKWDHVSTVTNGKLRAAMSTAPSHEAITQCMQDGGYPIIKIDRNERVNHWVVIVGKSEDDYYIRDPRDGQADDGPLPLSNRSNHIYSMRCVSLNTN